MLSGIAGDINNGIARIKSSASASALEDAQASFQKQLKHIQLMIQFQNIVASPCPEPAPFLACKEELLQLKVPVSKSYHEFAMRIHARQAMMRNDTAGLCTLCLYTQPGMLALADTPDPYSQSDMIEAAEAIIVDSVLEAAQKIPGSEVGKKLNLCPNKQTVCSINTELMAFSASEKFPDMKATKEDLPVLGSVLDPEI